MHKDADSYRIGLCIKLVLYEYSIMMLHGTCIVGIIKNCSTTWIILTIITITMYLISMPAC